MNALQPLSSPHRVEVPFAKIQFGGETFGFMPNLKNSVTGAINSDFVTSLSVEKFGSGAVNKYTAELVYVIDQYSDPNYVDMVISKATDRKIVFEYGDLSQPDYSYKNETGIISDIVPNVDYKNNTIRYTITATSSTSLNYSLKKFFPKRKSTQPSRVIYEILYNNVEYGLLDLLPGMLDRSYVEDMGWIPTNDLAVDIDEKKNMAPIDYILYLVSLMKGTHGEYFYFKIFDAMNENQIPHFEIRNTLSKKSNEMLAIDIGLPGSIPVFNFSVNQNTSFSQLIRYQGKLDSNLYQDFGFNGDPMYKNFYSDQVFSGNPSEARKLWWEKMLSFPLSATLETCGLYVPAEIVQSVLLNIYFFGKKYNHSGEYLIMGQKDSISRRGFRTTLELLRISGE